MGLPNLNVSIEVYNNPLKSQVKEENGALYDCTDCLD